MPTRMNPLAGLSEAKGVKMGLAALKGFFSQVSGAAKVIPESNLGIWMKRAPAGSPGSYQRDAPHLPQHQHRPQLCTALPHQRGRSGRAVSLCRSRSWQISLPGAHGTEPPRSPRSRHPARRARSQRQASSKGQRCATGSCRSTTTLPVLAREGRV